MSNARHHAGSLSCVLGDFYSVDEVSLAGLHRDMTLGFYFSVCVCICGGCADVSLWGSEANLDYSGAFQFWLETAPLYDLRLHHAGLVNWPMSFQESACPASHLSVAEVTGHSCNHASGF